MRRLIGACIRLAGVFSSRVLHKTGGLRLDYVLTAVLSLTLLIAVVMLIRERRIWLALQRLLIRLLARWRKDETACEIETPGSAVRDTADVRVQFERRAHRDDGPAASPNQRGDGPVES